MEKRCYHHLPMYTLVCECDVCVNRWKRDVIFDWFCIFAVCGAVAKMRLPPGFKYQRDALLRSQILLTGDAIEQVSPWNLLN